MNNHQISSSIRRFSVRGISTILVMAGLFIAACQPSSAPSLDRTIQSNDAAVHGQLVHGRQPLPHFRAIAIIEGPLTQKVTLWICGFDGIVYRGYPKEGIWKNTTVPGKERLYALAAEDEDRAWVAGWGGVIYRTENGGKAWRRCRTPGIERITSLHRCDDGTIIAVGDLGVVWTSSDGLTFELTQRLGEHGLRAIHLNNNGIGMIVGYSGNAYMTIDKGQSWRPLATLVALQKDLYGCHVSDDDNSMWAVGSFGALVCSRDGGQVWTEIITGNPAYHRHISFNGHIGIISGYGCVLYSKDKGLTWESVIGDHPFQYIAACIRRNGESWVCGEYGSLHELSRGGSETKQFLLGIGVRLNAIAYIPESTVVFAVGEKGVILTSTDSGQNWSIHLMTPVVTLNDILVASDKVLIVGRAGAIFTSSDQGQNWSFDKLSVGVALRALRRQSNNRVWVCGDQGFLACHDEESLSWTTYKTRFNMNFYDMFFFDERKAIVVGSAGTILETNDGCSFFLANYTGIDEDLSSITGRGQQAVIAGQAGIIMETLTGASGSSWNLQRFPNATTMKDVSFSPSGHLIAVGEGGQVMVRYANGSRWLNVGQMPRNCFEDIAFANDRVAFACGSGGAILRIDMVGDGPPSGPRF